MINTQIELRRLFKELNPDLDYRKIKDHSGNGLMYKCDTRCCFNEWIDNLQRDGMITERLARKVTL